MKWSLGFILGIELVLCGYVAMLVARLGAGGSGGGGGGGGAQVPAMQNLQCGHIGDQGKLEKCSYFRGALIHINIDWVPIKIHRGCPRFRDALVHELGPYKDVLNIRIGCPRFRGVIPLYYKQYGYTVII